MRTKIENDIRTKERQTFKLANVKTNKQLVNKKYKNKTTTRTKSRIFGAISTNACRNRKENLQSSAGAKVNFKSAAGISGHYTVVNNFVKIRKW